MANRHIENGIRDAKILMRFLHVSTRITSHRHTNIITNEIKKEVPILIIIISVIVLIVLKWFDSLVWIFVCMFVCLLFGSAKCHRQERSHHSLLSRHIDWFKKRSKPSILYHFRVENLNCSLQRFLAAKLLEDRRWLCEHNVFAQRFYQFSNLSNESFVNI